MFRFLLLCLLLPSFAFAQVTIQGTVRDAKDKSVLSFCSVGVKGTGKGTVTNEDGVFALSASLTDTLTFYYLGYKKKTVIAAKLQENSEVLLSESVNTLGEVTIRYDEEKLYKILLNCRKQLLERKAINSKAYYQLETKINNDPVEMLECYYNARVQGSNIENLAYKNGRVGLSKYDGRYFASMNTSKAIQYLDLTKESPYLPDIPLQQEDVKVMMADYKLSELPGDETSIHISFTPKKNKRAQFKGDLWMDKETNAILKIELSCDSAAIHPFKADGLDKLGYVSMNVKHTYQADDGPGPLNHIDFSYQFDYIDRSKGADKKIVAKAAKRARTKGVIYFYDFKRPFKIPYYKYDAGIEDYEKIAMLPYNDFFWKNTEGLVHTEEQQQSLDFLAKKGQLMNFKDHSSSGDRISYSDFVEVSSLVWSDTTRVIMTRKNNDDPTINKPYQVKAQIYMDVNVHGDAVDHFSTCVFDSKRTFFTRYPDDKINCFVNIYFDLLEIERLKMEDKLEEGTFSVEEIDEIYKLTMKKVQRITEQYLDEVNMGDNEPAMKQWNAYVRENLGLDNMKTFKLQL
jgi:hypothetical protein